MIYAGTHALQLHNPANTSMLKTQMLVIHLNPAPSGKHGDFVYKYAAVCSMREYGLDDATCTALAERADKAAEDRRHSLTMYIRSGAAVYLAPITVQWCDALEHVVRFGPPNNGWERFLERAINKTLEEGDRTTVNRLQQLL
jgi:hypothetical protein